MGIMKKILLYLSYAIITFSLCCLIYFPIKKEMEQNERSNYLIIDSHHYKYYAIDYMALDKQCLRVIDNNYKNIIICGPYTIKQLK